MSETFLELILSNFPSLGGPSDTTTNTTSPVLEEVIAKDLRVSSFIVSDIRSTNSGDHDQPKFVRKGTIIDSGRKSELNIAPELIALEQDPSRKRKRRRF